MFVKNYSILFIRRRRHYLLRIILIIVCLSFVISIKDNLINSFLKNISINNISSLSSLSSRTNVSYDKTILNCSGDPLKQWCKNEMKLCDSFFIVYNKLFAVTRSVILQAKFAKGKRLGGEALQDVLNQPEKDEYFHFDKEFIQVKVFIIIHYEIKINIYFYL